MCKCGTDPLKMAYSSLYISIVSFSFINAEQFITKPDVHKNGKEKKIYG